MGVVKRVVLAAILVIVCLLVAFVMLLGKWTDLLGGVLAGGPWFAADTLALLRLVLLGPLAYVLVKFSMRSVFSMTMAAVGVAVVVVVSMFQRDVYFGPRGAQRYVCPAVVPGAPPRVQADGLDRVLGGECPAIDAQTAMYLNHESARPQEQIQLTSVAEVDALALRDANGAPAAFAGTADAQGRPRLWRRLSYDPYATGAMLRPATPADLAVLRSTLLASEQQAASATAKAEFRREREARRAAARAREETLAALRRARVRLQQSYSDAASTTLAGNATFTLVRRADANPAQFFREMPQEQTMLVVYVWPGRFADRHAALQQVAWRGAPVEAVSIVTSRFFDLLDLAAILRRGDLTSLADIALPEAVTGLMFVEIADDCPSCAADVISARFVAVDLRTSTLVASVRTVAR